MVGLEGLRKDVELSRYKRESQNIEHLYVVPFKALVSHMETRSPGCGKGISKEKGGSFSFPGSLPACQSHS